MRAGWLICLSAGAMLLTSCAGSAVAPVSGTVVETSSATVASGASLFAARCAACHGTARQGSQFAPALTAERLAVLTEAQVRQAITSGRSGTAMASFQGTLTGQEIEALVKFLKN